MKRLLSVGFFVLMGGCAGEKTPLDDLKGLDLREDISHAFAAPILQSYQNCDQLKNDLKETALRENATRMAYLLEKMPYENYYNPMPGGFTPGSPSPSDSSLLPWQRLFRVI